MGNAVCPNCRQNAPIVYRGVSATCTACGAPRMPLANTSVNLAGQPTKVGGTVTRVFGWIALVVGLLVGFGTLAACGGIFGFATAAPWVVSIPILLITLILSKVLLSGGRSLEKSGDERQKATRNHALFAMANTRGGVLTANEAAVALNLPPYEADKVLTAMAKEMSDHVSVDVNDDGVVLYRFQGAQWAAMNHASPALRVDQTPPMRVEDPRDPLVEEFEALEKQQKQQQVR